MKISEQIESELNEILLGVYDLSIANAPIVPGECREISDLVARHIGQIRSVLTAHFPEQSEAHRKSTIMTQQQVEARLDALQELVAHWMDQDRTECPLSNVELLRLLENHLGVLGVEPDEFRAAAALQGYNPYE